MQIEVNMRPDFTARDLPRVVLLDIDGTLTNSEDWWYQAETGIIANLGAMWSKGYMAQVVGSSLGYVTPKTMADFGLLISPQELGRRLVSRVCEIGEASKVPRRPDAYELLSLTVNLGIPTVPVTSSCGRFTHIAMRDAPPGSLTTIIARGHGLPGKPGPAPYLRTAGFAGADPSSSLVVEDSVLGVQSGVAARMRVIHMPYMVDMPPTPGPVKIDSLESVDGTALRYFMDKERPQGDPYTGSAPNLKAIQRGDAAGGLSDIRRKLLPSAAVLNPSPRAPVSGGPPFVRRLCWGCPFRHAEGRRAFLAHGQGCTAKGGTALLEMAPIAQPGRLVFEVGRVGALLYRVPYGVKLKDDDVDVIGDQIVGQRPPVFEVDDLHASGELSPWQGNGRCIEAHLKKHLVLESRAGGLSRFVVDDAERAVGRLVDSIDYATHSQTGGEARIGELLVRRELYGRRIPHAEAIAYECARTAELRLEMREVLEEITITRFGLQIHVSTGKEKSLGHLFRADGGGPATEMLQSRMHEDSSKRLEGRRLGEPINRPEPKHQGTLLEVFRPREGKSHMPAHVTTVRRVPGALARQNLRP